MRLGFAAATIAAGCMLTTLGCSTNDNPTDPEKMTEIRHKEAADRAGFNPNMAAKPGQK